MFPHTSFAPGAANHGTEPLVFASAWTKANAGQKAGGTFQNVLDARTDALVSLACNAGELATIATVTVNGDTVDLVTVGGFDTSLGEGTDMANAILLMDGAAPPGLDTINLETAKATLMADLG